MTLSDTAAKLRNEFPDQLSDANHAELLNAIALAHMEDGYGLIAGAIDANSLERRDGVRVVHNMLMNSQTGQVFQVLEETDGEVKGIARAIGTADTQKFVPPLPAPTKDLPAPSAAAAGSHHAESRNGDDAGTVAQTLERIHGRLEEIDRRLDNVRDDVRWAREGTGTIDLEAKTITFSIAPRKYDS